MKWVVKFMESRRFRQKVAFMDKENAELKSLTDKGLVVSGNALSSVILLKGKLNDQDLSSEGLLSGRDGDALRASLVALKYQPQDWLAISTLDSNNNSINPLLLRQAISVASPTTVIICDEEACEVFRNTFAEELASLPEILEAMLAPGQLAHILGMRVINLGGFEASLDDMAQKQTVWSYLKKVPCTNQPY